MYVSVCYPQSVHFSFVCMDGVCFIHVSVLLLSIPQHLEHLMAERTRVGVIRKSVMCRRAGHICMDLMETETR